MRKLFAGFFALSFLFLAGCTAVDVSTYQNTSPTLRIEEYFNGKTRAWGVFQDRFGQVRRSFTVDITGTWDAQAQTLKLVEDFVYSDGETEQRIWHITKTGPDTYTGTANRVVGQAIGRSAGNAFNFRYTFDLPVDDSVWRVKFDDWMFLQPDDVLFNKATITRFGVRLGDVYITFKK